VHVRGDILGAAVWLTDVRLTGGRKKGGREGKGGADGIGEPMLAGRARGEHEEVRPAHERSHKDVDEKATRVVRAAFGPSRDVTDGTDAGIP